LKIVALFYGIEVLVEERKRHWDSLRIGMFLAPPPCRTGYTPRPKRLETEAGGVRASSLRPKKVRDGVSNPVPRGRKLKERAEA